MDFNPKLKNAMAEIKAILDKHDIGGLIILHIPGHGEHLIKIDPSYSCAFIDNTPGIQGVRVRAKLSDYSGDSLKLKNKVEDTVNMFQILTDLTVLRASQLIDVSEMLKSNLDIVKTKGKGSSGIQQNN